MTNADNLKQQLESFKSQMMEVNQSLENYEELFKKEQEKVKILRESFCAVIKLINHELINSLNCSTETIDFLLKSKK